MRQWLVAHEAATSVLVYGELVEYNRPSAHFVVHHRGLHDLVGKIRPFFLTYPILERYADLRLGTRRPHGLGLIGDIDTLIAATALERRVQVVTTDGDFPREPDLGVRLLGWTSLNVIGNRSPNR